VSLRFAHVVEAYVPPGMYALEVRQRLPGDERTYIVEHQAAYGGIGLRSQHHSDQSTHRSADPVDKWSSASRCQALNELCQRAGMRCVRDKRNQGRRVGQIERESVILLVFEPIAGAPSNHVHANNPASARKIQRQGVEISAVACQAMDANDDVVFARVSPLSIDDAMKSMGIKCKEAVLARIRWHVRMQPSDTRLRRALSRGKPSMTMPCIRR
jgi:hypothetical protein